MKIGLMFVLMSATIFGQTTINIDVFNRYVWRGTDFGNSASIQPTISYTKNQFTLGAWGAWSVTGAPGGNENDLFISTKVGPLNLVLTDYFFPEYSSSDKILELDSHVLEMGVGTDILPFSLMVYNNFSGDTDNSTYIEAGYKALFVCFGNGLYSIDGDFAPVNVGFSAERGNMSVSYIINLDQETSFLVAGIHF